MFDKGKVVCSGYSIKKYSEGNVDNLSGITNIVCYIVWLGMDWTSTAGCGFPPPAEIPIVPSGKFLSKKIKIATLCTS